MQILKNDSFGYLVFEVYSLLSLFLGTSINYVFYEGNSATHGLTIFTLVLDDELSWWEEFPLLIELLS